MHTQAAIRLESSWKLTRQTFWTEAFRQSARQRLFAPLTRDPQANDRNQPNGNFVAHQTVDLYIHPWRLLRASLLAEPDTTVRALGLGRTGRDGELRQALSRLYATIDDPGSDQYMQEHSAFHWALIAPAASPVMRRVVELLWQMSERYIRLTVASPEHRRVYAHHHEPLVAAMESGDPNRVREEMIRHLSEAEEVVLGPRDNDLPASGGPGTPA